MIESYREHTQPPLARRAKKLAITTSSTCHLFSRQAQQGDENISSPSDILHHSESARYPALQLSVGLIARIPLKWTQILDQSS